MHVTSADGARIKLHTQGAGPDLLLVHGSAADHRDWSLVTPLLSGAHRVHAMDRRGRGASGDGPTYSIEREGDDIAAVCRALGTPAVFAHSYGAVVALEAARRGAPIRKLILYEPPIFRTPMPDELSPTLSKLVAAGDRDGALAAFLRDAAGATDEELAMMRQDEASWRSGVETAHTLPREVQSDFRFRFEAARYKDVRTPTLLLVGTESPPFFGDAVRMLQAALPDARLEELPGQGHAAMLLAPDLLVGKVQPFLR